MGKKAIKIETITSDDYKLLQNYIEMRTHKYTHTDAQQELRATILVTRYTE